MIRKVYVCKECDFRFERTVVEEENQIQCPICGSENVNIIIEEEKKPVSCSVSSKYT